MIRNSEQTARTVTIKFKGGWYRLLDTHTKRWVAIGTSIAQFAGAGAAWNYARAHGWEVV